MKNLLIALSFFIFYSSLTQAQQVATLDVSFDTDGVQYFDYSNELRGAKILVQPDGKIISATAFLWVYTLGSDIRYTFNRYNANGSIDNTFGTNGQITHSVDYSTPSGGYVLLEALKLQADGKIVAVGGSNQGTGLIVKNKRKRYT